MVYVPLPIKYKSRSLGATSLGPKQIEAHFCYDCNYEYVLFGSDTENHHLYTTINNRMYRWSLEYGVAHIWHVGEPGVPGAQPNRKMFLIKTFKDSFPEITPENIERKLRFMLLFL
jgi:hypothetical protein